MITAYRRSIESPVPSLLSLWHRITFNNLYSDFNLGVNAQETSPTCSQLVDVSPWGCVGTPLQFKIIAKTQMNKEQEFGGDIFRVILKHETSGKLTKGSVQYLQKGTYKVVVIPEQSGVHHIITTVNAIQLPKLEAIQIENRTFV
jgi:hypothetical protein